MFMRFVRRHARRPLAATVACSVVTVVGAAPAAIQSRTLEPRVAAKVVTKGEAKTLMVRVTDKISGKPITHARVTASAEMRRPHVMIFPAMPLKEGPEGPPGTYRSRYDFLMAGMKVTIRVSGANVVTTTSKFRVSARVPPTLSRVP
jgi:hypothetical protein